MTDRVRVRCPWCSKAVSAQVPYLGDGSGYVIHKHKDQAGKTCEGWRRIVVTDKRLRGDQYAEEIRPHE